MTKQRSHRFTVRVSFSNALTKREALYVMRDSGQMGKGAEDFFSIDREDRLIDGEMKVTAISPAKAKH